ncbi:hypothetical protein [Sphingomonas sp. R86520]|uniref:hypothetical protein n=1 Tax=Sphingomonas sp. R86520 TaxID=3093859 RepID=UPI0036D2B404
MKNEGIRVAEIAMAGDGSWFDKHPERRLRIRAMIPGEFDDVLGQAPVGMTWRTIVLEAQPGARSRQAIALPLATDIDALGDGDLFNLFLQAAPPGARDVIASMRKVKLPPGGEAN